VALSASTAGGSRDTFGIDNFTLTYAQGTPANVSGRDRPAAQRDKCLCWQYVSFTVHATGAPLHYQMVSSAMRRRNAFINGAISPTLSLSLVTNANAGSYYVVVSNNLTPSPARTQCFPSFKPIVNQYRLSPHQN